MASATITADVPREERELHQCFLSSDLLRIAEEIREVSFRASTVGLPSGEAGGVLTGLAAWADTVGADHPDDVGGRAAASEIRAMRAGEHS